MSTRKTLVEVVLAGDIKLAETRMDQAQVFPSTFNHNKSKG
jgi:hypothetical protein